MDHIARESGFRFRSYLSVTRKHIERDSPWFEPRRGSCYRNFTGLVRSTNEQPVLILELRLLRTGNIVTDKFPVAVEIDHRPLSAEAPESAQRPDGTDRQAKANK